MLLGYLNVFRLISSHFSLIIKGCCSNSFWSSGFELDRRVFSYATD